MTEKIITIKNRAGIHARPAAMIVQAASKFSSRVFLEKTGERINAKSIMGIITLGAGYETELKIIAEGEDEAEAVDTLFRLIDNRFEED